MKGKVNKTILYNLFPFVFIHESLFSSIDTVSAANRILIGVSSITILLLLSFVNIVGYFFCIYILKDNEFLNKYPKLKPVTNYYKKTSVVFLIIEIIFVIGTLLLVLGLCLHILYLNN